MKIVDCKLPFACPDTSQFDTTNASKIRRLSKDFVRGLLLGREETGLKFGIELELELELEQQQPEHGQDTRRR